MKTEAQEGRACWRTHSGAPGKRQLWRKSARRARRAPASAQNDKPRRRREKLHKAEPRMTRSCKMNCAQNQLRGPSTAALSRGTASMGFPAGAAVNSPPASEGDARDAGSVPRSGRPPGGGNGNPLQYSCLGNPMDRGACWATVLGVAKIQTQLSN